MRVVVVGLDGFPHSLALRLMSAGIMPNFQKLLEQGTFTQMDSIFPTVSNVAWTSYMTGKNPGGFGVFGFAELTKNFDLYIPNSRDCRSAQIQEILSEAGKNVVSLGVPGTFPPRPVKGIAVGGFLAPSLEKGVFPVSALEKLNRTGYLLDINPMKARESLDYFKEDTLRVLRGREDTLFSLWDGEPWDYLAAHFMDTDRLMHFMYRFIEEDTGDETNHTFCLDFFRKLDGILGRVAERLDDETRLIVLSDHGFCRIRREVQLNRWLQDRGYLTFSRPPQHDLDFEAVSPQARAIALVPGKIYILEEGKFSRGGVRKDEYGELREEIVRKLKDFSEAGRPVCQQVYLRDEVLSGPYLEQAPDIIIDPHDGYDFKAGLKKSMIFETGPMSGMHTQHDAMFFVSGADEIKKRPVVYDVTPTILKLLDVPIPSDFDGQSLT